MSEQFMRDEMARFYAERHRKTDPGIRCVYYLPHGAPDREIRMIEVNDMMVERDQDPLEPLDFGVDIGSPDAHKLMVLDVTPAQWERISKRQIPLPENWSLDGAVAISG